MLRQGLFLYVRQEEDVARHELDAFFQVVQTEQFQIENGQSFVLRAELVGDVPQVHFRLYDVVGPGVFDGRGRQTHAGVCIEEDGRSQSDDFLFEVLHVFRFSFPGGAPCGASLLSLFLRGRFFGRGLLRGLIAEGEFTQEDFPADVLYAVLFVGRVPERPRQGELRTFVVSAILPKAVTWWNCAFFSPVMRSM